jgi:hypothetical protein
MGLDFVPSRGRPRGVDASSSASPVQRRDELLLQTDRDHDRVHRRVCSGTEWRIDVLDAAIAHVGSDAAFVLLREACPKPTSSRLPTWAVAVEVCCASLPHANVLSSDCPRGRLASFAQSAGACDVSSSIGHLRDVWCRGDRCHRRGDCPGWPSLLAERVTARTMASSTAVARRRRTSCDRARRPR